MSAVDPAHFGVPSTTDPFPEGWAVMRGEIGGWFIRRAPFLCMIGSVLSVIASSSRVTLPRQYSKRNAVIALFPVLNYI